MDTESATDTKDTKDTKKIIYTPCISVSKKGMKPLKEEKKRVVCDKWVIQSSLLAHASQLKIIEGELLPLFKQQIESKLYCYKQQDIKKNLYNETKFVTFDETLTLLQKSGLLCCYCSASIFVLYENVRDPFQWSLDRVNNDMGHNSDNLLVACLKCNLKRRRINMDSFMFTRKMKLVKGT
jgi:hypothetical protein